MSTFDAETDGRLRAAAFAFLDGLAAGGQLVRQDDLAPFTFDGTAVRLMATQQGIWKPRQTSAGTCTSRPVQADGCHARYQQSFGDIDVCLRAPEPHILACGYARQIPYLL